MRPKQYVKACSDWLYGLKKGEVFELIRVDWWNGEDHALVKDSKGKKHEYPYVFFVECGKDGSSIL